MTAKWTSVYDKPYMPSRPMG